MDMVTLPNGSEMELETLASEYVRLHAWCSVCLGEDVAKVGGICVDAPAEA